MKILVCITHVPDTTSKISFTDNNTKLNKAGVQYIIGPYDDYALARAIELKEASGGTVTVLNVGEADTEPTIRKALAIGADDAIRINAYPEDAYFVATQIAEVARTNTYDLILKGRESIQLHGCQDHGQVVGRDSLAFTGGQGHGLGGELLGSPSVSPVMQVDITGGLAKITREIEGGKEYLEVKLPFVAGCQEPIAEWKIPNMRGIMSARTKPLQVVNPTSNETVTTVAQFELPPPKGTVKMIPAERAEELITLLRNEAKVI